MKKIGVEDIIGLVKTDDITNSVELKKSIYYDAKKHDCNTCKEKEDLKNQLILANAWIKMVENIHEDCSIEDYLYNKYPQTYQKELNQQIQISKEELDSI